jgi:hypothetical protein
MDAELVTGLLANPRETKMSKEKIYDILDIHVGIQLQPHKTAFLETAAVMCVGYIPT